MSDDPARWNRKRAWQWTVLFAGNLVVPLPLGLMSAGPGWPGVVIGVVALWAGGLILCARMDRFGPTMLRGAAGLMWAQFFPAAQMLTGVVALGLWQRVAGPPPADEGPVLPGLDMVGGFAVTLLTAMPLITAAFTLAALYRWRFEPAVGDECDDS